MNTDPTTSSSLNTRMVLDGPTAPKTTIGSGGVYARFVKPILDRGIGLALFILTLPILIIAALLIRLKIGTPVIYVQDRVGMNGKTFNLYKLRTMVPDRRQNRAAFDGSDRRLTHKSPNDPRVLPIGKTLRSLRLDEIPQFWNVVTGDMSLVGPRPELPEIVAGYKDWQHQRHLVKPGVTGPWQISERNGKPMHEYTEIDLEYIADIRFRSDISILIQTPIAMIGGRRGY